MQDQSKPMDAPPAWLAALDEAEAEAKEGHIVPASAVHATLRQTIAEMEAEGSKAAALPQS